MHKDKRIARGEGSGHGGTATKGHKGAKSRSGNKVKRGFEGGQTPMHRRLPKVGFKNISRIEYYVMNLDQYVLAKNDVHIGKRRFFQLHQIELAKRNPLPYDIRNLPLALVIQMLKKPLAIALWYRHYFAVSIYALPGLHQGRQADICGRYSEKNLVPMCI